MRVIHAFVSVILVSACGNSRSQSGPDANPGSSPGEDAPVAADATQSGSADAGEIARRTSIVFAAAVYGQASSDLYIVERDGTGLQRLTSTDGSEMYPSWSPDHTHIAFVRGMQLFVIDAAGGNEHLVAPATGRQRTENGTVYSTVVGPAAWSPDGTQLAYLYPRPERLIDVGNPGMPDVTDEAYATTIHFVWIDGTADHAIANDPGMTINSLAWTADNMLSFSQADDCPDCAGGQFMSIASLDGSGVRQLTYGTANNPYGPTKQLDWTPNRTHWVFVRGGANTYEQPGALYTSRADNATETPVGTVTGWNPRWSPDGLTIAYIGAGGIYVTDVDGRATDTAREISPVFGLDW